MTTTAMLRSCRRRLVRSTWHNRLTRSIFTAATDSKDSFHHETQPLPPIQSQIKSPDRRKTIQDAKPFSEFLTDNFNRQHDYLRISVTERCNLRCLYCMPEEGVPLSPPAHLLTTPEIFYLSSLFVSQGVTKIRLTGGEPTVRSDILPLMQQIGGLKAKGLRELALTTNGISLHRKLDKMVEAGLTGVNISLDTLDPFQFQLLTRRKGFDAVMKSINRVLEMNKLGAGVKLKVNCVVMRGINEREIIPFVEMGREKEIEVRFIEYMPFGGNKWSERKMLTYQEMLDMIREKYPGLRKVKGHRNDTSKTWEIPGFVGKMGFITSMTHNFCGTCNRLRITGDGNLKVCLHGNTEVSLRDLIRKDNHGEPVDQEAFEALKELEMNRHQGLLMSSQKPSWVEREQELLNVIGEAVKRKKEKHAGMDELQNMENRPMILIAEGDNRARKPIFSGHTGLEGSRSSIPLHLLHSNVLGSIGRRMYSTSSRDVESTYTSPGSVAHHKKPAQNKSKRPSSATDLSESSDEDTQAELTKSAPQSNSDSPLEFQSLRSLFGGAPSSLSSSRRTVSPLANNETRSKTNEEVKKPLTSDESPTESSLQARRQHEELETDVFEVEGKVDLRHATIETHPAERTDQPQTHLKPEEEDIFEERNDPIRTHASSPTSAFAPENVPQSTDETPVLTHLTSSGEAHMVDVGEKASTERVAIAFSAVRFSNQHASRLIAENSNKKGDVLGVARIAGLMAAKKCSDIIPLCHPISITKIQVDLELVPGTGTNKIWDTNLRMKNEHGLVLIEARVHCHGKTGVEMEALTAASAAALTVYDMCKAVDKEMAIVNTRLAFKDGGKKRYAWKGWQYYHKDNEKGKKRMAGFEWKKRTGAQAADETKFP